VLVALMAAGLMVATTNRSDDGSAGSQPKLASLTDVPTTEPGLGQVATAPTIASMEAAIRPSAVALVVDSSTGTSFGTGLVVEASGFIVTTSRAVPSARSVTVVEPNGTPVPATKVGSDAASGISVLKIGDDLAPADFDFAGPSTGSVAVAMALEPDPRADAPVPMVYAGKVVAGGVALGLDPISSVFAAFGVEAPLSSYDIGCPLLNADGQVVGMLERVGGKGLASVSTFLPAELVWGVADQLVSSGTVDPGWMGVTTGNAVAPSAPPTPVGAIIDSVAAGGPAAASGIESGDIVTAIDGYQVRSRAELDTRLYTEPPGSQVMVTLERSGTRISRTVMLADADPDAPETAPSP
jgi:putative serine protease PepD